MPTSETLAPERVERLVAGDVPETAREALVAGLVRELRAAPAEPPEELRARVAALRAPAGRPRPRRLRLVVALALLAVAAVTAAILSLPRDEGPRRQGMPELTAGGPARENASVESDEASDSDNPEFLAEDEQGRAEAFAPAPSGLDTASNRAQEIGVELELRVADADAVSETAGETMRIVRELGGHVVASDVATEGREGTARLRVAVPTRRLEDALVGISALGTVTGQRVEIEDLQRSVDRRANRIEALERAIRRDEIRLASDALTPEERLRVELRIERLRDQLGYARRQRAALLREAASAEVTVDLHTREVKPGAAAPQGRIERAARDGLAALAVAASVSVFVLILGGPLLLLAALAWGLRRRRVRRTNESLLDRPGAEAS
jgi:hypothetical protein